MTSANNIKFMEIIIVPIIKNITGVITDKDHYWSIVISSVVFKILELLILERLQFFTVPILYCF